MKSTKLKKMSTTIVENFAKRTEKGLELARRTFLAEKTVCGKLRDAIKYYTSHWKNFTHPGLFSIAYEAVGGNPDNMTEAEAVIAMIAAALDIHDDIIDESKTKLGSSTVFGKYGQNIALLSGDAFFVSGFTLLGKILIGLPEDKAKEISETFRRTLLELGSAHALESNFRGKMNIAADDFMEILKMKAASIEADMRIGAIMGNGSRDEVEALARYGRILGLLATLREEFIDVFEIEELHHRISSECLPIPILYAMQNKESKEQIQRLLGKKKMATADIDELVEAVFEARSVKDLKGRMKKLVGESCRLVSILENSKLKTYLGNLTLIMLEDL